MLTEKNQNRDLGRLKGWGVHMDNGCYRYHTTKISLCDSERQLNGNGYIVCDFHLNVSNIVTPCYTMSMFSEMSILVPDFWCTH